MFRSPTRNRSVAVRFSSKQAADSCPLLVKPNREEKMEWIDHNGFVSVRQRYNTESHPADSSRASHNSGVPTEVQQIACCSMQGWRKTMEDHHCIWLPTPSSTQTGMEGVPSVDPATTRITAMLGVFDGHNGDKVSSFVASRLPSILTNKFEPSRYEAALQRSKAIAKQEKGSAAENELKELTESEENAVVQQVTEKLVCEAFEECDESMRDLAESGGSTAGVAFVTRDGWLVLASCGDCRLAVVSEDGSIRTRINTDHCPVVNKEEAERLNGIDCPVVGGRVQGKIGVSRAFGDFEFKPVGTQPQLRPLIPTPTVKMIHLQDKKDITRVKAAVIGCDGVWETQELDVVAKAVADGGVGAISRFVHASCATNQPVTPDNKQLLPGSDNISLAALLF